MQCLRKKEYYVDNKKQILLVLLQQFFQAVIASCRREVQVNFVYMFIRFIILSSTYDFPLSFFCLSNMCYCKLATKIFSKKIRVLKKSCLHSTCSTVMAKNFKRIHVKEFLFTEITVLECATLPNNELLHRHFPTFLNTIVDWYITTV